MLKKLLYPSFFDVSPVVVYQTKLGRSGEEEVIAQWEGLCNYSESNKRVQNDQGLWVHLSGVIHIKGDIFPDHPVITGYVVFNGQKLTIAGATRPRNPDGSINHTRLELI